MLALTPSISFFRLTYWAASKLDALSLVTLCQAAIALRTTANAQLSLSHGHGVNQCQ